MLWIVLIPLMLITVAVAVGPLVAGMAHQHRGEPGETVAHDRDLVGATAGPSERRPLVGGGAGSGAAGPRAPGTRR
ncbi:MAG TPA: hypothetical protein VKG43_06090 [Acidimicrobiales bacterium]|nr:hypothetical protein [Acidimicrobiales bacterium]